MGGSGSHICRLTPRKNEHLSGCGEDCFAPSKSRKSSSNWSLSFSYQIYKPIASRRLVGILEFLSVSLFHHRLVVNDFGEIFHFYIMLGNTSFVGTF